MGFQSSDQYQILLQTYTVIIVSWSTDLDDSVRLQSADSKKLQESSGLFIN